MDTLVSAGVVVDVVIVPRNLTPNGLDDGVYGALVQDAAAKDTGGRAFEAGNPTLATKFADRLAALRAGYVVTYTPRGARGKGDLHQLSVRLRSRKGVVEARKSYVTSASLAPRRKP